MTRPRPPAAGRQLGARRLTAVALSAVLPLVASCTAATARVADPSSSATSAASPAVPSTTAAKTTAARRTTPARTASAASRPTRPHPTPLPTRPRPAAPPTAPLVVVLDPGHNGGNESHVDIIDRPVYAGNGLTKPCNTVGASTLGGYPEHAFTFDVALRARALLARHRITVLLTRSTDTGVGPCVDARARFGNAHAAAAVVAIHADGAAPAGHGFHVIEAAGAPAGPATAAASRRLALAVRAALRGESGLPYATYLAGGTGLDERSDLAGLNLSTRPAIFVECGNMPNAQDAAVQTVPAGRQRIARALVDGILAFLGR